jgi:hypothetical protein
LLFLLGPFIFNDINPSLFCVFTLFIKVYRIVHQVYNNLQTLNGGIYELNYE